MHQTLKYFFLYGAVLWAASCHLFEENENREEIARAGKYSLYLEDLEDILVGKQNYNDSIEAITKYVDAWVKTQILLQKAEFNLGDQKATFDKQIEQYRKDLLIFAYQQEFLKQNLDTNISTAELEEYYQKNNDNFFLKENILIADFAVFPNTVPKKQELIRNYSSTKQKDLDNFKQAALKYAKAFSLDDPTWIPLIELTKIIPIKAGDQTMELRKNKSMMFEDTVNIYFLRINDYKSSGDPAPLFYVEKTIKNILINRRKLELQRKLEEDIIAQAYKNKEIKINLPKNDEIEISNE
jgi:hypothetical protein